MGLNPKVTVYIYCKGLQPQMEIAMSLNNQEAEVGYLVGRKMQV